VRLRVRSAEPGENYDCIEKHRSGNFSNNAAPNFPKTPRQIYQTQPTSMRRADPSSARQSGAAQRQHARSAQRNTRAAQLGERNSSCRPETKSVLLHGPAAQRSAPLDRALEQEGRESSPMSITLGPIDRSCVGVRARRAW
jgi:hypothetical protein